MQRQETPPIAITRDSRLLKSWVIYQFKLRRSTLSTVANNDGVSKQCVYQAFDHPYPRMEKLIAEALGLEPRDLWPDRYDEHGLPINRMGRPAKVSLKESRDIKQDTKKDSGRNVQSARYA
jgi:Ner family transcriptional regulator